MCANKNAHKFQNRTWVKIVGIIEKGTYHSEIPIVNVSEIVKIEKPENEFVYPPGEFYLPTISIL